MRNATSPRNNSMPPTQVLGLERWGGGWRGVPTLRVPSTGNSYLRPHFPLSTQFPKETRGFPGLQGLDKTPRGLQSAHRCSRSTRQLKLTLLVRVGMCGAPTLALSLNMNLAMVPKTSIASPCFACRGTVCSTLCGFYNISFESMLNLEI